MTVAWEATSHAPGSAATAQGSTQVTPSWPAGVAAGRLAVFTGTVKPETATFDAAGPVDSTGGRWTKVGEVAGGAAEASGADTGPTRLGVWVKELSGSESGTVSLGNTGGNSASGSIDLLSKDAAMLWSYGPYITGYDDTHDTFHTVLASGAGAFSAWPKVNALVANDLLVACHGSDTDAGLSTFTAGPSVTQPGATFGAISHRTESRSTTGNQCAAMLFTVPVLTGSDEAGGTFGFEEASGDCGPYLLLRLREVATKKVQPKLEVGFSADASLGSYLILDDAARGKLDTGTLAPDSLLVTIPNSGGSGLREFTAKRGATRVQSPVVRYEAGTFSAVLNDDQRNYDPDNLAGPYVAAGVSQVTPGRVVRLTAAHLGVVYELWRGSADNWETTYFPPSHAEALLTATDGFALLAGVDRTPGSPVGANEDTGARLHRVLDSASWPALDRDIATGTSTLAATDLGGNALEELLDAADAELGEFYADQAGRAFFRSRQQTLTDSRSVNVQASFSAPASNPAPIGTDLKFFVAPPAYDREQLANQATISRAGGTEQTVTDNTSKNRNGLATFRRTDLPLPSDTDAANYAGYVVFIAKDPERRFAEIVIWPEKDPDNLYPHVLGRRIGDRIKVTLQPPGGGSAIVRECFIRGITHSYRPMWWETRWILQAASRYSFLVLDHATLGKLDSNALSY